MKDKIRTREELSDIVKDLKNQGKRIVHTNGSYDILHAGHIDTLERAKQLGDILIVSINSDDSVRRFKGNNRPIMDQEDRARILSSLECVDFVTIFPEDNILETIRVISPSLHVKGGTFLPERIEEEKKLIESLGGSFMTLPLTEGKSTTNIIKKIIESSKK